MASIFRRRTRGALLFHSENNSFCQGEKQSASGRSTRLAPAARERGQRWGAPIVLSMLRARLLPGLTRNSSLNQERA